MDRQSIREAIVLIIIAALFGFAYTSLNKQGFFSEKPLVRSSSAPQLEMIPLAEAKQVFETDRGTFIDSRHAFEYRMGHIPGAINVTLNEFNTLSTQLQGLPKNKLLVVYCDGAECNSSIEAAMKLSEIGFTNVKIFFGGWQEWSSSKLPVDK